MSHILRSIVIVNTVTLSAFISLQYNREHAECAIMAIALPQRMTSQAAPLVMSLGQCERGAGREGGLHISGGCWEKQCVTAVTQTHTQRGTKCESEAPWKRQTHTHTHTDTERSNTRLTDELSSDRLLLSIYQAGITNAGANMRWMGRQYYPAVYHRFSLLFTCQSAWVNILAHTNTNNQEACRRYPQDLHL